VKIVNKSLVLRNKVCKLGRSHVPPCMSVQQLRDGLLFATFAAVPEQQAQQQQATIPQQQAYFASCSSLRP
jgi:hypothetical protein